MWQAMGQPGAGGACRGGWALAGGMSHNVYYVKLCIGYPPPCVRPTSRSSPRLVYHLRRTPSDSVGWHRTLSWRWFRPRIRAPRSSARRRTTPPPARGRSARGLRRPARLHASRSGYLRPLGSALRVLLRPPHGEGHLRRGQSRLVPSLQHRFPPCPPARAS
jgi:hypothetical protein